MLRLGITICFLFSFVFRGYSQPCTALGQTPATAFPVCGITDFTQKTVPLCSGGTVPIRNCSETTASIQNPFWYKFTCYIPGKLGFVITPLNSQKVEDYDWQLFDITGRNPNDIFTDPSMIVTANWVGTRGVPTGASAAGTSPWACASFPDAGLNAFATMPELLKDHEYLLLVSHFLSPGFTSEEGYVLSFQSSTDGSGGFASITDPNKPVIKNVDGVCDGTEVTLKLNKKIKCNSLAADGSDFLISGPVANSITGAISNGCSTSFDMDTVRLKLSSPMVLGTYKIISQTGTDGNSLLDNCDQQMATGQQVSTFFTPAQPTPMDSVTAPVCIKDSVQLVFRKPILCNSIAADGTDFTITGPVPVTVRGASGVCINGVSTYVTVLFSAPIRVNGSFTITLKNGTDGNTLIDECAEQTPAGSTIPFTTKDITVADFQPQVSAGCKYDTLHLSHDGNGNASQWKWEIDTATISNAQQYTLVSKAFGNYTAQLTVSNGICSDTITRTFTLPDNTVKAAFSPGKDTLCPANALEFTDESSSNTVAWRWNFGNGTISNSRAASPQNYPLTNRTSQYVTSLAVRNATGCADTTYKIITVLASCYIAVPSAFTPNGDGLNDYFYPLNAFKAGDIIFRVYNRWGQLIFESSEWTKKWDGRFKGLPQPTGTYVWTFNYTHKDSGKKLAKKGSMILIR